MIHILFKLFTLLLYSKAHFEEDSTLTDSDLLGYQEGIVRNESFMYYYIYHSGNITISLTSSDGDADLYISDSKLFPTYYPEMYDIHSATCGVEVIDIPLSFRSPIAVGVYGYSAHELTHFFLKVFKNPQDSKGYAIIREEKPENVKEYPPTNEEPIKKLKLNSKRNTQNIVPTKRNYFLSLFEVLGLIFL